MDRKGREDEKKGREREGRGGMMKFDSLVWMKRKRREGVGGEHVKNDMQLSNLIIA